jgi:hypothetical protein
LLWQQLMASQVMQGRPRIGVIEATLVSTFAFTKWLAAPSMPWFVLGFVAMVILNSVVTIPVAPKAWIALGTTLPALHGAGRHGHRDGLPQAQDRRP